MTTARGMARVILDLIRLLGIVYLTGSWKGWIGLALIVVVAAAPHGAAHAQATLSKPDLMLPKQVTELGSSSPLEMGIWKPKGDGPFPALILVHTCAGIRQQIGYWRKEAVRRGYVAFVIDSFTSRGSPSCRPQPPASMARGVKDVFDAAEQLGTFALVDKSRIAILGLSWGAMVGLRSASPSFVAKVGLPGRRLSAVVSLYPACFVPPFGTAPGGEILHPDVSTPTLVLMGAQDNETLPQECVSRLEPLKERGAPVEWHVFPNASHCWDCIDQDKQRWNPPWAGGRSVVYLYDSNVTDESAERAFEFLSRHLKLEPKK
jgi:dienelactone hydrolase